MPKRSGKAPLDANSTSEFGKGVAEGGIFFTTSSIIRSALSLVLLVVLARLLQPSSYGLYSIVVALALIMGMNTDFGVGNALRKKLPESGSGGRTIDIINNSYFASLSIGLCIFIIGMVAAPYVALYLYHNASLTLPIRIGFAAVVFSALMTANAAVLLGLRKGKIAGLGYIAYALSSLIASVVLVLLGYGVTGALFGLLAGYVVGFALSLALVLKHVEYRITRPSWITLKELYGFSTPVLASNMANTGIRDLGVVLLGIFATAAIVGNYGAAFKLGSLGDVILVAFMQALVPAYSYAMSKKGLSNKVESIYNRSVHYTLVFLLPLLVFLIASSRALIYLLFSSAYGLAPLYFAIIATGIVVNIFNRYGSAVVIGAGKVKEYMKYQVIIAAAVAALLFILTPLLGVMGVLIALFVVSPVALDVAFVAFLKKRMNVTLHLRKLFGVAAASLVLLAMLYYSSQLLHQRLLSLPVNAAVALVAYPPLLVLLRGADSNDIGFIESMGKRMHISAVAKPFARYASMFLA
ncbi:MAG: oligosaccharide flippase family protein [Candidatus Micrarchaeaceae archaeon]